MNITITRRLEFCAGHRVHGHENKCAHLHGHGYTVFLECRGINHETDSIGRVIDFSVIKGLVGTWIDEHWDHRFLIFKDDPLAAYLKDIAVDSIVELRLNPTAENLAEILLAQANTMLAPQDVEVIKVTVHETPNCSATVEWP